LGVAKKDITLGETFMLRLSSVFVTMGFLLQSAAAQDKTKVHDEVDPIIAELSKAKQEYEAAVDAARDDLLSLIAKQEKRITESTKLGTEERVKQIELLREEKKAFESEGKLPKTVGLKTATSDYRTKVATAQRRCEKAFDAAAEQYVKKDLAAAKGILAEKAEFFRQGDRPPLARAQAKDVRRFWRFAKEHGGGYFKQLVDGKWEEIGRNGELQGTWVEKQRTAEYVELEDRKRGYLTRLGAGKAWIASNSDGKFGPSPHGDWER
jgi:hypothetical protein